MSRSDKKSNVRAILRDAVVSYNSNAFDEDYFDRKPKSKLKGKNKKSIKRFKDE